jgi:hypothetical protein
MYLDPFWAGVVATILAETLTLIVLSVVMSRRS